MPDPTATYAGLPFLLPDERVMDRLAKYMPLARLPDALPWPPDYPGADLQALGLPEPPLPPADLGLGDWWYPSGMSRFSVYRGLMTGASYAALGAIVAAAPTGRQPFVLADGAGGQVATPLHVLPPRPLAVGLGGDDLYLVTLVDERYFLQTASAGAMWVKGAAGSPFRTGAASGTWPDLFTSLAAALGISLSVPASFSSAYGTPEPDSPLYSTDAPAAALLDAAAACVGCVVVRPLTYGTDPYLLQTVADARASAEKSGHASRSLSAAVLPAAWGGFGAGTDAATNYRAAVAPTVTVSFPAWNDPSGWHEPTAYREPEYRGGPGSRYAVDVTPAAAGGSYSGWATGPGRVVLSSTAKAVFAGDADANGSPTNLTALTTLAKQLARDWYDRQRAAVDRTYPGVLAWLPDGCADLVWSLGPDKACTRAVARPLGWGPRRFHHRLTDTTPAYRDVWAAVQSTGAWDRAGYFTGSGWAFPVGAVGDGLPGSGVDARVAPVGGVPGGGVDAAPVVAGGVVRLSSSATGAGQYEYTLNQYAGGSGTTAAGYWPGMWSTTDQAFRGLKGLNGAWGVTLANDLGTNVPYAATGPHSSYAVELRQLTTGTPADVDEVASTTTIAGTAVTGPVALVRGGGGVLSLFSWLGGQPLVCAGDLGAGLYDPAFAVVRWNGTSAVVSIGQSSSTFGLKFIGGIYVGADTSALTAGAVLYFNGTTVATLSGTSVGALLVYDGSAWQSLAAPSANGTYKLRCVVTGSGTSRSVFWTSDP